MDYKSNWVCPSCRPKIPKGDNSNTPVRGHGEIHDASPTSNVTLRRTQLSTQTSASASAQDTITLESIKLLIHEEMKILLGKTENNLAKFIDNKIKEMSKEIYELKESVNFVNNQYEDLKNDVHARALEVVELKKENENLKSTVKDLNSRLSIMEQHSRMCNVEIQCLPEHRAENLPNIVTQIGRITGNCISETDIHKCTRIAKMNADNPRPRSIIVKFSSPRIRDIFLAGVIKFNNKNKDQKLNTSHIGMGGEAKPIYVVEHLTPELKKLHAFARLTAKKLQYKYVWVKNSRVFIKKTDDSERIVVQNIEQLKQLSS